MGRQRASAVSSRTRSRDDSGGLSTRRMPRGSTRAGSIADWPDALLVAGQDDLQDVRARRPRQHRAHHPRRGAAEGGGGGRPQARQAILDAGQHRRRQHVDQRGGR